MGWDNAGGYNRNHNFSADASAGIKILAARMDTELDDFASAMTIALTRNGQNVPTVNLPMGGFRHINVGAPTSVNNYMRSREFIENVPIFMTDAQSSTDRISVSAQYFTSVSANQAPGDGTRILVRVASNKTSAVLYLNGHSANVEYQGGNAGPSLASGGIYDFVYSSVDSAWKVQNPDDGLGRTAAEVTAGVTPSNLRFPELNVMRYGAVDDDSTDNTTAIQNAFNVAIAATRGTVVFPVANTGIYRHGTGLTLAPASNTISVNLHGESGAGGTGVVLKYTGAGGTALTVKNNTRYKVTNLALLDAGTGAIGLRLMSIATGSNTGPAIWENIRISSFTTCAHFGSTTDEAISEHKFINFEVGNCTDGVLIEGSTTLINTLNVNFFGLLMSSCTTGLRYSGPAGAIGNINVFGGSCSNNGIDFDLTTPTIISIKGMFIDSGGYFMRCGPSTPATGDGTPFTVTLENILTNYSAPPSSIICKFHHAGIYTLRNCIFQNSGHIEVDGVAGGVISVDIANCTINDTSCVTYTGNRTVATIRQHYVSKGTAAPNTWFDDRHYVVNLSAAEYDIYRFARSAGVTVMNALGTYTDADATPSVAGIVGAFVITNSGATTITDLDDQYERQEVMLLFTDANTTIQDGSNFQLAGGANFVSSANDTLTVVSVGGVWYEKSRSVN